MAIERTDPWFVYALGGGLGHLNRSLSLARQAARYSINCIVLTNSPHIELVRNSLLWQESISQLVELRIVPTDTTPETLPDFVADQFNHTSFSRLVVDTFPRGIAGELAQLLPILNARERSVLVARDISPQYIQQFQLSDFAELNYGLVISPGDHDLSWTPHSYLRTEPWLIRDFEEMTTKSSTDCESGILVCCSGKPAEHAFFEQLLTVVALQFPNEQISNLCANECTARKDGFETVPSLRRYCGAWPGMDIIEKARVVVGAAGYNLVAECKSLGVPLIAVPQRRLYDRQDLRAREAARHVALNETEVIAALTDLLPILPKSRKIPLYVNGALQAAELILRYQANE